MPTCMSEDGNGAIFVGTLLQTGDTFALCEECFPSWCLAMFGGMSGLDPDVLTATVYALENDAETEANVTGVSPDNPQPVITTGAGAPTDEPPPPAPADTDPEARPPVSGKRNGGRGSQGSSDPPTDTESLDGATVATAAETDAA